MLRKFKMYTYQELQAMLVNGQEMTVARAMLDQQLDYVFTESLFLDNRDASEFGLMSEYDKENDCTVIVKFLMAEYSTIDTSKGVDVRELESSSILMSSNDCLVFLDFGFVTYTLSYFPYSKLYKIIASYSNQWGNSLFQTYNKQDAINFINSLDN